MASGPDRTPSLGNGSLWADLPTASRAKARRSARLSSASKSQRTALGLVSSLHKPERVIFLDIETTGLSRHYDELTLVGYAMNGDYHVNVSGDEPKHLFAALKRATTLVTFNGTLFDVPFLKKTFGALELPPTHLDLRYLARRVGLTGGQKAIEQRLSIQVRHDFEDMSGGDAVVLWHQFLRGDDAALSKLITYNQADIRGMSAILDHVVMQMGAGSDLLTRVPSFFDGMRQSGPPRIKRRSLASRPRIRPPSTFRSLFAGTPAERAVIVGVDLTGSAKRPSGFCLLDGSLARTMMVASDDEIISEICKSKPTLVSIDSPLSLPRGRVIVTDDDPGRAEFGIMRLCERELKRRGINVYPSLLPSMQQLTKRGMNLAARLRQLGMPVIESYPGAAQDIMRIPRKGAGEQWLKLGLAEFGVEGDYISQVVRHDELDAITSALVGSFFLAGKYEALSGPTEGSLIIPDLKPTKRSIVVGISGRIAAGKTSVARYLERRGYSYTRFSLVLDEEIRRRGEKADRETRQRIGIEINRRLGQRWLCERVIERVHGSPCIVVDGLRFPEDHAFMTEMFGADFLHLHINAPTNLRCERYALDEQAGVPFSIAEVQPVEGQIDLLRTLAHRQIDNSGSINRLEMAIESVMIAHMPKGDQECRSLSS